MTVHHSQDMRHCVDTLVQQVVHTAGAETVNQKLFKIRFTRAMYTPKHSHESNHALWEKVSA